MTRHSVLKSHGAGSRRLMRGFTIIELGVVIVVIGLIATIYARYGMVVAEEQRGNNIGELVATVHNSAEDYARKYRNEILNNTAITTPAAVANTRAPTTAELFALGQTNISISPLVQRAGNIQVRLNPSPVGCVVPACEIEILTYIDGPVLQPNTNTIATTVLAAATRKAGARAGGSEAFAPTRLRGLNGAWDAPNPVAGNPVGIFAMLSSTADIGMSQYVQIRDSRDPDLQGNLTVAGATTLNGPTTINNTLQASDTSVGACAKILAATGRAGFGCANPNDLPAGYTGGVRSPDVVASGRILASDSPATFTGANGNYVYAGVQGGVAEIRTSGRAAGDRLTPLGQYVAGAACPAADEGSIARRVGVTGLVVCQGSTWRPMSTGAAAGDVCAPEGAAATSPAGVELLCVNGKYQGMDTIVRGGTPGQACTVAGATAIDTNAGNEQLLCRANPAGGGMRYMRLRDLTQNLTFVQATEVSDITLGATGLVNKPNCAPAATQTAVPVLQLIGKAEGSPDGGFSRYAVDVGTAWEVYLRNGAGAVQKGVPYATAIAQVFCYYP